MDFAARFTAIDFETANRRPDSACQLAAVVVRDGKITDSAMWMIRPKPLFFSRTHIQIHGITPDQVRGEPEFGEVWPEIAQTLAGDCLVAHNASFDIGVLLACLRSHNQQVPDFEFQCTRNVARRAWPTRRRYGLKPLADWLGIRFRHHDALEDSIACAKVMLAAGIDSDAKDLADLEKKLRMGRGTAGAWGHKTTRQRSHRRRGEAVVAEPNLPFHWPTNRPPSSTSDRVTATPSATTQLDLQRLMVRGEFIRPLSGRSVAFLGRLSKITQQQAAALTERLGGQYQETMTEMTDLVVVGSPASQIKLETFRTISKNDAAAPHCSENSESSEKQLCVMDEDEFLGMLVAK
jgi:DNA polymerase-3 subunit epsilon